MKGVYEVRPCVWFLMKSVMTGTVGNRPFHSLNSKHKYTLQNCPKIFSLLNIYSYSAKTKTFAPVVFTDRKPETANTLLATLGIARISSDLF